MSEALNSRRNPLQLLLKYVPVPSVFVLAYLCGVALEYVRSTRQAIDALPSAGLIGGGLFVIGAALAGWDC
jgi:hypothetical protein